jgi:hypothetical protein
VRGLSRASRRGLRSGPVIVRLERPTRLIAIAFASRGISRSRPDLLLARGGALALSLTGGACPPVAQPIPQARCKVRVVRRDKPNAILCASSEEMCGRINPTKKTALSRVGRASFEI